MNQELERFEPSEMRGRISYEHFHRYAICRDRVAGKRVLDVASGAGYGANILAEVASHVIGLDIDAGAVRRAARAFKRDNLVFEVGDCCDMPFEVGTFDVVVANEMIEHIEDHVMFVKEVRRVLRPGGVLLVSTPNKLIYNRYKRPNPFHVSEMTMSEFRRLLSSHFGHVHLTGLRMALVSAGFDVKASKSSFNLAAAKTYHGISLQEKFPYVLNDELRFDEPEYVLATCSDEVIDNLPSHSSIYFSNEDDLWLEHEKIMHWASQLHEEDENLRADLRQKHSELELSRTALENEKASAAELIARLRTENGDTIATTAHLLGKISGQPVSLDAVGMIDALFSLNERFVEQRFRLEALEEAQRRAGELEQEVQSTLASRDQLAEDLRRAEQARGELVVEQRFRLEALEEAQRRAGELEQEVQSTLASRDQLAEDLRRAEQARDAERLEQKALRIEREALSQELGESRADASRAEEKAEKNLAIFQQQLSDSDKASAALTEELLRAQRERDEATQRLSQASAKRSAQARSKDAVVQVASVQQRRKAQLLAAHRQIRQQIAGSHGVVQQRLSAVPRDRPRPLVDRFRVWHPLHRTLLYDRSWVQKQLEGQSAPSIRQYLRDVRFYRIDPHPLFAAEAYLNNYPDVAAAGISPLQHYLEYGWREGRDPHPYFANDWYLEQNPDVLSGGTNPLEHYLLVGWKEGRWPNPVFDPAAYLDRFSDVKTAGVEPLTHYVMFGRPERRAVPFQGLEHDWRSLAPESEAPTLIDQLLSDHLPMTPEPTAGTRNQGKWPPLPMNGYWLPQQLRNVIIDGHGDAIVDLYWFLCSVMDGFSDDPVPFESSEVCFRILERIRSRSRARADHQRGNPDATIVVPVYNNFLDTILCLASVLEVESGASFEIIVADDGSDDATTSVLPDLGGVVRYVRQPENLGFLGNSNVAAREALGETIILLNNDTLVLPGWLDGLLAPFARMENVGLVGSKLISWDGTLQEAGGIFWKDGSAWNFGRGQDARAPQFNYLKEVDYCSGASIAVPTTLWRQLGGFDPNFAPAYCEDADLAFRIRLAGYQTLYNPQSEVIHHEGRSHGRDLISGIKANQVTNLERFAERWGELLRREHYPNGENVLWARDRSRDRKHVLVVDHYVPQWDQDAGSRSLFQYLQILLDLGFHVTFWPDNLHRDPIYTPVLQSIGIEVIYYPEFGEGFEKFIADRGALYDAVFLNRPYISIGYLPLLKEHSRARILYNGVDLHYRRMERSRDIGEPENPESIAEMRDLELRVCRQSDVIFYPDPEEVKIVAAEVGGDRAFIANPVYVFDNLQIEIGRRRASSISQNSRKQLFFVGGFNHRPNLDGILWFVRDVLPLIAAHIPEISLFVAGSNAPPEISALASERIAILGRVSDEQLEKLYAEAPLAIAPLRYGAGVKGKVIEAMAQGVPMATTSIGTQGVDLSENPLFVGDSADEFAGAVVFALTDRDEAQRRAERALNLIEHRYSRAAMADLFWRLIVENANC